MNNRKGGAWDFLCKFKKLPEANIQAEFYHQCRLLGLPCILEYSTVCGRHDLAMFDLRIERLLCIIECKTCPDKGSRQIQRYQQLGVPIFKLCSMVDCEPLALKIQNGMFSKDSPRRGVPIEDLIDIVPLPRRNPHKRRRHYIELDQDLIIRT